LYQRIGNPTREALEHCIAKLEDATYGIAFGSGMAAIMTVSHLLNSGDEIVAVDNLYGGTNQYFTTIAVRFANIKFILDPMTDMDALSTVITPKTKVDLHCRLQTKS
jgi:cystathionine beta-lyase/cystathionine gamma-synthase